MAESYTREELSTRFHERAAQFSKLVADRLRAVPWPTGQIKIGPPYRVEEDGSITLENPRELSEYMGQAIALSLPHEIEAFLDVVFEEEPE